MVAYPQWIGAATRINQVDTITVASTTSGHTFVISLANPSGVGSAVIMGTYVAGAAESVTTIANALYFMLTTGSSAGSSGTGAAATLTHNHEFVKALSVAANVAGVITITAAKGGVPFILTVSGTGTFTRAAVVANNGPNDWNTAGNWSTGVKPAGTDQVTISGSSSILYGLNQGSVTDIGAVRIRGYTGTIGSLGMPLNIDVNAILEIDMSGRAYISLVDTTASVVVFNTGGSSAVADPGLTFVFNAGTVTSGRVNGGNIRILGGTFTLLQIDGGSVQADAAIATTLNQTGGNLQNNNSAITTYLLDSGNYDSEGFGMAMTTMTQNGGNARINDTDITTFNLRGGTADCSNCKVAMTITTLNMKQAARLIMDTAAVTVTTFTREGVFDYHGLDYGRSN